MDFCYFNIRRVPWEQRNKIAPSVCLSAKQQCVNFYEILLLVILTTLFYVVQFRLQSESNNGYFI